MLHTELHAHEFRCAHKPTGHTSEHRLWTRALREAEDWPPLGRGPGSLAAGAPQGTKLRPGGQGLASRKWLGGRRKLKWVRGGSGPGRQQIFKSESPFFSSQSPLPPSAFCLIHSCRASWLCAEPWGLKRPLYPRGMTVYVHTKACTWMFLADLFVVGPNWTLPKVINRRMHKQIVVCACNGNSPAVKSSGW